MYYGWIPNKSHISRLINLRLRASCKSLIQALQNFAQNTGVAGAANIEIRAVENTVANAALRTPEFRYWPARAGFGIGRAPDLLCGLGLGDLWWATAGSAQLAPRGPISVFPSLAVRLRAIDSWQKTFSPPFQTRARGGIAGFKTFKKMRGEQGNVIYPVTKRREHGSVAPKER